jgi:hypothetical protein
MVQSKDYSASTQKWRNEDRSKKERNYQPEFS